MKLIKHWITPKQMRMLRAVQKLESASLLELSDYLDYSGPSSAQRHVDALKKKGLLACIKYEHRSLKITGKGMKYLAGKEIDLFNKKAD